MSEVDERENRLARLAAWVPALHPPRLHVLPLGFDTFGRFAERLEYGAKMQLSVTPQIPCIVRGRVGDVSDVIACDVKIGTETFFASPGEVGLGHALNMLRGRCVPTFCSVSVIVRIRTGASREAFTRDRGVALVVCSLAEWRASQRYHLRETEID